MNELGNHHELSVQELLLQAFAQSREVATLIRADLLPVLQPSSRVGAERLLRAIASRRIFDGETCVEIEVLENRIELMVADETEEVTCWDNDPHNMSGPACWTELRRSDAGNSLWRLADALNDLHTLISAVLDHRAMVAFDF